MIATSRIVVAALAFLPLLVGCGDDTPLAPAGTFYPKSGVTMGRGNAQGTGVFDTEPLRNLSGVNWKINGVDSTPTIANGIVYYLGSNGFHAVYAGSGKSRWDFRESTRKVGQSHAYADGVVYFTTGATLYALDAASGKEVWRFAGTSNADNADSVTSPVVAGDLVYYGYHGYSKDYKEIINTLYAVDQHTGKEKWKVEAGSLMGPMSGRPVVSEGVVYISHDKLECCVSYTQALDAATGQEKWRSDVIGSLVAADGILYVSGGDYYKGMSITALDANTGQEKWVYKPINYFGGINGSPAIADGVAYICGGDGTLYAVDVATGKEKWHFQVETLTNPTSPSIAGGVVYFAAESHSGGPFPKATSYLYAVDTQTRQELWRFATDQSLEVNGGLHTLPVIADGVVYLGAGHDNELYAIR